MNDEEKRVVAKMIAIYCRSVHGSRQQLCDECSTLQAYAFQRLERCPYGEEKPTCASCPIHCYKNDMRLKIKAVMRKAGPRMLFLHPIDTVQHFHKQRRLNRNFAARSKPTPKN
jgi:hypothetical protein